MTRVKSSINYPVNLHSALKKIHDKDITGRTFNQIVLDLLYSTIEVKHEIKEMKEKK